MTGFLRLVAGVWGDAEEFARFRERVGDDDAIRPVSTLAEAVRTVIREVTARVPGRGTAA